MGEKNGHKFQAGMCFKRKENLNKTKQAGWIKLARQVIQRFVLRVLQETDVQTVKKKKKKVTRHQRSFRGDQGHSPLGDSLTDFNIQMRPFGAF